jgi:hypothetical protein
MGLDGETMKNKEKSTLELHGHWKLTAKHIITGEVITREGENLIVASGKALAGDMLIDEAGFDTGLTYCAIGTDATAPDSSDTALGAEVARKALTSKTRLVNVITLSTFFTAGESTYDIKEAGIFGHDADGTPDSGEMFNHYLVSFDNSLGAYDLTFSYALTIG